MNQHARLLRLLVCTVLLCGSAPSADGALSVSVRDGTISPGGQLLIEVGIESSSPPEQMAEYELILQIKPLTITGGTSLHFVDPQSEAFLDDADYVFAATSEAIKNSAETYIVSSGTDIAIVDFSVTNDAIEDLVNVPITTGQILVTLDLQHNLGGALADNTIGDQFSILIDEASGFYDADGEPLSYGTNDGTITLAPTAIPEPGVLALLVIASGGLVWRRHRRP